MSKAVVNNDARKRYVLRVFRCWQQHSMPLAVYSATNLKALAHLRAIYGQDSGIYCHVIDTKTGKYV